MVFSLFASRRTKMKKKLTRSLDVYVPGLKGMDKEELGMLLDQAAHIKSASLMMLKENDKDRLFWENPVMVDEKSAFDRLDFWHKWMLGWHKEGIIGDSKIASFNVYFFSLGTIQIVELRYRGKEMWKELSRGFPYCKEFDPKEDIPLGFEQFNK